MQEQITLKASSINWYNKDDNKKTKVISQRLY